MKTLNRIQTVAKIAKFICTLLFIFGIIGLASGVISLTVILLSGEKFINSYLSSGLIVSDAGSAISFWDVCCLVLVCIVASAGQIVICGFGKSLFNDELKVGTPFNFEIAKKMQNFGIITLVISITTDIISSIIISVIRKIYPELIEISVTLSGSLIIAIAFIVLSLICKYGAEMQWSNNNYNNNGFNNNNNNFQL